MDGYQLVTVSAFISTYDRDVLDLQECPKSYIDEIEGEVEGKYPHAISYDVHGNKVWPVALLREHLQIQGEPKWAQKPQH